MEAKKKNQYKAITAAKKEIKFGQDENGMHWAEIKIDGIVQSAITAKTAFEIHKWIHEKQSDET